MKQLVHMLLQHLLLFHGVACFRLCTSEGSEAFKVQLLIHHMHIGSCVLVLSEEAANP